MEEKITTRATLFKFSSLGQFAVVVKLTKKNTYKIRSNAAIRLVIVLVRVVRIGRVWEPNVEVVSHY